MKPANHDFPRRLVEGEGQSAELIARALAEPLRGPSEQRSWSRLATRPRRALPRWSLPFGVSVVALAALLLWLGRSGNDSSVRLQPEARPQHAELPVSAVALERIVEVESQEQLEAPAPLPPAKALQTPQKAPAAIEADSDASRCAQAAREGQYDAAAACYDQIARGNSMAAELALYEKARLESKALGREDAALTTLEEHTRRFPSGVLATEVEISRIELLIRLRKPEAALLHIEQALQGAPGRERGGDLQALRADLLSAQGNCEAALSALQEAQHAGVHPSRFAATERRCSASTDAANAASRGAATPTALTPSAVTPSAVTPSAVVPSVAAIPSAAATPSAAAPQP